MKILEATLTVRDSGNLVFPAAILQKMGLSVGDHVKVAYLTDDSKRNTFKEFLLTTDGVEDHSEEQQIIIPNQLLQQANISPKADIQIVCLDGAIVIKREEGLDLEELAEVLDGLYIANNLVTELSPDPKQMQEQLRNALDELEEKQNE